MFSRLPSRILSGTLGITLLSIGMSATAADVFVDIEATSSGIGNNWSNAYKYLGEALADPGLAPGNTVHIADGSYFPGQDSSNQGGGPTEGATFTIPGGVRVIGGYAGQSDQTAAWDPETYTTILDGNIGNLSSGSDNAYHVTEFLFQNQTTTIVRGLTIQNGRADGSSDDDREGGGVFVYDSQSLVFSTCRFLNNYAHLRGGAVSSNDDTESWKFYNCEFRENSAPGYHDGSTFLHGNGGAIHAHHDADATGMPVQLELFNCVFVLNDADSGGAVSTGRKISIKAVNCSFAENIARDFDGNDFRGGAIRMYPQSGAANAVTLDFLNCVFWNNLTTNLSSPTNDQIWIRDEEFAHYTATIDHNLFEDIAGLGFTYSGAGNFESDPLFRTAECGDLRPLVNSPLLNAGLNSNFPTDDPGDVDNDGVTAEIMLDLDLSARIEDTTIDIGAYEGAAGIYSCPADLDGSCEVDAQDLLILLANWGTSGQGADLAIDLTIVDTQDLLVLLAAWGNCLTGEGEVPKTIQDCIDKYGAGTPECEACIQALQLSGSS